ncbi:MAG: tryptophan synthase subunit alpha [Deltaproteobacteria bacterium]|nr:tryptophan synthase subunit alpha [Deltaproteobacteria bacterium]
MSDRISKLFKNKTSGILSIYFTAGYPHLDDTASICRALVAAGVDMIEVGVPFSDPIADGPIIEASSQVALQNGMNLELLFEQLNEVRKDISVPILLMGYLNPILQFGVQAFLSRCKEIGIDGSIIPDLPLEEYLSDYAEQFRASGVSNVFLITPQTTDERIRLIDANSDSFIYMVSFPTTTGAKLNLQSNAETLNYFNRVRALNLKTPRLIGFGISDKESVAAASAFANGVIVGSAFIERLKSAESVDVVTSKFISSLF